MAGGKPDISLGEMKTDTVLPQGSSVAELSPGMEVGQCRVIKLLGSGGMGQVYLVENIQMHKKYAMKILPQELSKDPTFIDRFRVEARVMADLDHPNIVHVQYIGEDSGRYFILMDYVEGPDGEPQTLADRLKSEGKLQENDIVEILRQLCEALEYAHNSRNGGVIHRDLKPSNILLDKTGKPLVADFGLAKVAGTEYLKSMIEHSMRLTMPGNSPRYSPDVSIGDMKTMVEEKNASTSTQQGTAGALIGTYEYMAPEQQDGKDASVQSDIYSLGMILYCCLVGNKPRGRWKLPSKLGLSPVWDPIIEKALEPEPEDRYASTMDLYRHLYEVYEKHNADEPQEASSKEQESPAPKKTGNKNLYKKLKSKKGEKKKNKSSRAKKLVATIILLGMVIIIIMALFPPWLITFKSSSCYFEQPAAYSFIGSAPPKPTRGGYGIKIDTTRLFLQLFVTIFACSCCVILASRRKEVYEQHIADEASKTSSKEQESPAPKKTGNKNLFKKFKTKSSHIKKLVVTIILLAVIVGGVISIKSYRDNVHAKQIAEAKRITVKNERQSGIERKTKETTKNGVPLTEKEIDAFMSATEKKTNITQKEIDDFMFRTSPEYLEMFPAAKAYRKTTENNVPLTDAELKVKKYRKAAEQGDASAQFNLAICYNNGEGVKKDYAEAVKWFHKAAEQRYARAQHRLGYCYLGGRGVKKNNTEAVKWFRKAAEQGDISSQCWLGNRHSVGRFVKKDYAEAVKWYRKAAEQGDAWCQYSLGNCYAAGKGVQKNYTEAVKWYRKAAEQVSSYTPHLAQRDLGDCYYYGRGVKKNYTEAVKWYFKAAEWGSPYDQYRLGNCYAAGEGVQKNYTEAVKWYRKSAAQGYKPAIKTLSKLK